MPEQVEVYHTTATWDATPTNRMKDNVNLYIIQIVNEKETDILTNTFICFFYWELENINKTLMSACKFHQQSANLAGHKE